MPSNAKRECIDPSAIYLVHLQTNVQRTTSHGQPSKASYFVNVVVTVAVVLTIIIVFVMMETIVAIITVNNVFEVMCFTLWLATM